MLFLINPILQNDNEKMNYSFFRRYRSLRFRLCESRQLYHGTSDASVLAVDVIPHKVVRTKDFFMAKHELSQTEWE
jgi:hypothetical protein